MRKAGPACCTFPLFPFCPPMRSSAPDLRPPGKNISLNWFLITKWLISGGATSSGGPVTAINGSMKLSRSISRCSSPIPKRSPITLSASGSNAFAANCWRNRRMPRKPREMSAHSRWVPVSTPQNPRRPTRRSSTARARGSFTCCAKCFASQARRTPTRGSRPFCKRSSPNTRIAPSPRKTCSVKSKRS